MYIKRRTPQLFALLLASCGGGGAPADGVSVNTPVQIKASAGALGSSGNLDGDADAARFTDIRQLAPDANGNLPSATAKSRRRAWSARWPAGVSVAADGYRYEVDRAAALIYRVGADCGKTVAAGTPGQDGKRIGALPGSLKQTVSNGGFSAPPALTLAPAGASSFILVSGGALLKLVLPH